MSTSASVGVLYAIDRQSYGLRRIFSTPNCRPYRRNFSTAFFVSFQVNHDFGT